MQITYAICLSFSLRHGDYCLALKETQKNAYYEIKDYFASRDILEEIMAKDGQYLAETEKTACVMVIREYFITDDTSWFEDKKTWEKLTSIGYERKTTFQKGSNEDSTEERYFLCNIIPAAELFAIAVRRHWHIENNLHWTLDIVFNEDRLRPKEKNGILFCCVCGCSLLLEPPQFLLGFNDLPAYG